MKTITTIAAASILFTGAAFASPEFDNHDNYGSVLQDLGNTSAMSTHRAPTGALVTVVDTDDSYGSALFDLDQSSGVYTGVTQASIGDGADDAGNILYDVGARY